MNIKRGLVLSFLVTFVSGCNGSVDRPDNVLAPDTMQETVSVLQNNYVSSAPDDLEFTSYAVEDIVKLINGQDVDIKMFPGILNTTTCTASLIGPRMVLTAAHCIDNTTDQPAPRYNSARLNWFGNPYPLVCKMSTEYANKPHAGAAARGPEDFALCAIAASGIDALNIPQGSISSNYKFETLDVSGSNDLVDEKVVLTGFGCTGLKPYIFHDREDGFYKYKTNPKEAKYDKPRKLRVGATNLNDIDESSGVTQAFSKNDNRPVVCPGDSGGPIFSGNVDPLYPDKLSRRIIGVNSETGISNIYQGSNYPIDWYRHSNFSLTSSSSFKKLLDEFIIENSISEICIEGYDGTQNVKQPAGCHI